MILVRSIDLDSWSDEQVEPLVRWGNKRANIYWEGKLPDGYVPDDSKIENFIRTKYDLKRWALYPRIPDPATLDKNVDAEEQVPLAEVQKRINEPKSRQDSSRNGAPPPPSRYNNHNQQQQQQQRSRPQQQQRSNAPVPDLLDSDFIPQRSAPTTATQRPTVISTGNSTHTTRSPIPLNNKPHPPLPQQRSQYPSSRAPEQKPKPVSKPSASLIGLDFGPSPSTQPTSPTNQTSSFQQPQQQQSQPQPQPQATNNSRPDLKKSILSLYSTPSPSYQQPNMYQQQPTHQQKPSFSSNIDALSGLGNLSLNNSSQGSNSNSFASPISPSGAGNSSPFSSLSNTNSSQTNNQGSKVKTNAFDDLLSGASSAWGSSSSKPKPSTSKTTNTTTSSSNTNNGNGFSSILSPSSSSNIGHQNNKSTGGFSSAGSSNGQDEWAEFTSSSLPPRSSGTQSQAAFNSTSPSNPLDEDLFANVWK